MRDMKLLDFTPTQFTEPLSDPRPQIDFDSTPSAQVRRACGIHPPDSTEQFVAYEVDS